ncbi:hypothetical protein HaLaN_22069 [Haematococcus lacustris]|uniref:Uncharacterized protein n=1 Tax=Haematococcus lacustris TaxID=44745 RepID=A0A699ZPW2_HAELA|nr:hypothetical protein HaLaN_22069 [Haematococcus lacustris]
MQQPAVEDDDGTPVKEGELGEAVAKELGAYFQSEEGAGAFKLALRNFLMGALAQHGLQDKQHHRQRPRGRRHHRVVRCTAQADPA